MKDAKARSFVVIMIIIAVSALLLRIVIEQLIKINIAQNESNAQVTLRLIATALENYAKDHQASFPTSLSILTKNNPPYLDKDYLAESPIKGYEYSCSRLDSFGYSCSAQPVKCKLTGRMDYNITTAGILISEDCSKKE